jgi:folate-binding protein YgfZ
MSIMIEPRQAVTLPELGVLRVRGPDAVRFLQGQLSCDVTRLTPQRTLLAGYHNPQGRVIAMLRLLFWDYDDVVAIAPREILPLTIARLAKYVLRSKVRLADESQQWVIQGYMCGQRPDPALAPRSAVPQHDPDAAMLPADGSQWRSQQVLWMRLDAQRLLSATPAAKEPGEPDGTALRQWHALAIAAGEPQVLSATSEEFVAQMLNLDALGAVAFDKGCYTGQEVIARAHYRGRVKRRMQRFLTQELRTLHPGDSGVLADGRAFKVVRAVQRADGRCDFLAVAAMSTETAVDARPQSEELPSTDGTNRDTRVLAEGLPLPYPLPE